MYIAQTIRGTKKKKYWKFKTFEFKCFPNLDFQLSCSTLGLQTSSILKVEHTKGKFSIKILIKFNPSTQSSVTNCLVSAALASASYSAVPWLIMCCSVQSRLDWSPTLPHLISNLCHDGECLLVLFFVSLQMHCHFLFNYLCSFILRKHT